MAWHDGLESQFYLDGKAGQVASGQASGNIVRLELNGASSAEKITYLKERAWSQENLVRGTNGIAALTFDAQALDGRQPQSGNSPSK